MSNSTSEKILEIVIGAFIITCAVIGASCYGLSEPIPQGSHIETQRTYEIKYKNNNKSCKNTITIERTAQQNVTK